MVPKGMREWKEGQTLRQVKGFVGLDKTICSRLKKDLNFYLTGTHQVIYS